MGLNEIMVASLFSPICNRLLFNNLYCPWPRHPWMLASASMTSKRTHSIESTHPSIKPTHCHAGLDPASRLIFFVPCGSSDPPERLNSRGSFPSGNPDRHRDRWREGTSNIDLRGMIYYNGLEADRVWWPLRSSKPWGGGYAVSGGFDSYPFRFYLGVGGPTMIGEAQVSKPPLTPPSAELGGNFDLQVIGQVAAAINSCCKSKGNYYIRGVRV